MKTAIVTGFISAVGLVSFLVVSQNYCCMMEHVMILEGIVDLEELHHKYTGSEFVARLESRAIFAQEVFQIFGHMFNCTEQASEHLLFLKPRFVELIHT